MSHRRSKEERRRLKKLAKKTYPCYAGGAYFDENKGRYVRLYISGRSGFPKYLRKMTNKRLRRSKETFKYSEYKKILDYWWTLF